jgi:hypothetical protein
MPPIRWNGAVAQLGERVVRNDEVRSSILLSSTSGISGFPLFGAAPRRTHHPMHRDARRPTPMPTQKKPQAISRHVPGKTIVNWTYGDGHCPIAAIFFESRPIRLAFSNQFFLCVVTRRFGGGDRRRYMDSESE